MSSNWNSVEQNIGNVAPDSKHTVIFRMDMSLMPTDVNVHGSCGCLETRWDAYTKTVVAKIYVGKVPMHLKNVVSYPILKTVTVSYAVGGQKNMDKLMIRGNVIVH